MNQYLLANGGRLMAPYLVKQVQSPTLDVLDETQPDQLGQAVPPEVASTLTDLMIGAENRTQGGGKITGVQIAAKTGTAEHGSDPKATRWEWRLLAQGSYPVGAASLFATRSARRASTDRPLSGGSIR